MYYLIVSDPRYRYPILWLTLLPAGYFLSRLADQLTTKRRSDHAAHPVTP
jgi:hypothetical protein